MPAGRPLKFLTEQDLKKALESYFNWAIENEKPLTMARLVAHLDVTKDTFSSYKNGKYDNDENCYSDLIEKARTLVEADKVENMLLGKYNATSAIFDLKNNHGYKDKIETENTNTHIGEDGKPINPFIEVKFVGSNSDT